MPCDLCRIRNRTAALSVRARSGGEMDAGLKGVNGCMSAHAAWAGAVFGVCRGAAGGVVV